MNNKNISSQCPINLDGSVEFRKTKDNLEPSFLEDTLASAFQKSVNAGPDSLALIYENSELTYSQLDRASSQLALYIRRKYQERYSKELLPGTLIAIAHERSLELPVCILAVLKAGGAYVPIATDYPDYRIQYILKDSQAPLLLTQSIHVAKFVNVCHQLNIETEVIDIAGEFPFIQNEQLKKIPLYSSPNDLAYTIYTSGSTGTPKGTLVEQKGVVNLAIQETKLFSLTQGKRVLSFSHVSFDAFVWEFFGALLSGATLCMFSQEKILPGEPLLETLKTHKITHLTLPPSALYSTPVQFLPELEVLVVAGEPCAQDLINKWGGNHYRFFNAYGPTEATVCASIFEVDGQHSPNTIGLPLQNVSIYILDEDLNSVPDGEEGEICIGGIGIARGYLHQEELTKKSFITDPFFTNTNDEGHSNTRLYRSGDLARVLKDGNIEFIGRKDHQVKIRGFRIELGEIESSLSRHKDVKQAIVDVFDIENQKSLVAYITLKSKTENQKDLIATLREYLTKNIPSYMLPSYFMCLEEFPLTTSGKIDRNKLNELFSIYNQTNTTNKNAQLSESEEILIAICKTVLKCGDININDSFFDVGGHSLLMTQVILAIREKLEVNINIRDFLQATSLKELAKKVDELKGQRSLGDEPALNNLPKVINDPINYFEPFPLTDIQQAYWLGRHGDYDLSNVSTNIYREYKFKNLDILKLEKALNKVIQRQDMMRCRIINAEQQQFIKNVPFYKIPIQDLRGLSKNEVNKKIENIREEMSYTVLPSDSWPIFNIKASYLDDSVLLHVCLDALILDAWSFYLFFHEWEIFYTNEGIELPPLTLNFRDYVIAEQKIKSTTLYKEDRQYWIERIPNLPMGPDLPLAKSPQALTHQGTLCSRAFIEKATWNKLKSKAKDFNISPTTLLLSVFAEVLRTWSATKHFIINITLFNRLPIHEDVNKIIGDFTALELLEVDHRSAGFPSYSSFLERAVKLEAQFYEDLKHRLFSGVEVQREISRYFRTGSTGTRMPIVFTCVLDNDKNDLNSLSSNLFSFKNLNYGSTQASQVWLDFKAYEENEELIVEWDYVDELFPLGMIPDMHRAFCEILRYLESNESAWNQQCFDLLLQEFQEKRVDIQRPIPNENLESGRMLHELFSLKVKAVENKIAIISPTKTLTYGELNQRVNQLASSIQSLNAEPNSLIGIFLEKGWEQVVACLGILKAGYAYLPIAPDWPEDRIEQILKQSKVSALISKEVYKNILENIPFLKKLPSKNIIYIDQKNPNSRKYKEIISTSKPTDIAYVIYTSGSTGTPKGVAISHESAVNTILDINSRFSVTDKDSVLALSALHFDLSVYDIFGMLAAGGTIVFPSEEHLKDPEQWFNLVAENQITIWNSVPMLMQMMVDYLEEQAEEALEMISKILQLVLLSGDWIPVSLPPLIQKYFKMHSSRGGIISLGGATEASIWSVLYPIEDVDPLWESIPYGKAMKNQEIYVLNDFLEPCPTYVPGKIYIAGKGLALGYWQDKEKTESRFIHHPNSGKRLYDTGDTGRNLPDGNIELIGRDDFQIKIKGYRVELGDIQHHLENHPSVQQAVVVPLIENKQVKNLIACIVPRAKKCDAKVNTSELEFRLAQHGIRSFQDNSYSIDLEHLTSIENRQENYNKAKSYRAFPDNIELEGFNSWLNDLSTQTAENCNLSGDNSFSLTALGTSLSALSQCKVQENPFPRYLYPSAGGLYPVQTYLFFNKEQDSSQLYYYNPESHTLQKILYKGNIHLSNEQNNGYLALYFIGKMSAIGPLYGEESKNFCFLEAGYMLGTFCPSLTSHSWNYFVENDFTEKNELSKMLGLEKEDLILSRILVGKGSKLANMITSQTTLEEDCIDIYFYIKADKIRGLRQGLYYFNKVEKKLSMISEIFRISEKDYIGGNRSIFQNSSFSVFFMEKKKISPKNILLNTSVLLKTGLIAQDMKATALSHNIGTCPIGIMDHDLELRLQKITGEGKLLHSLVGGGITDGQMESPYSSDPSDAYCTNNHSLQKYLSAKLPEYMIPSSIHKIETIPLTSNGKVDRQALINFVKNQAQKKNKIKHAPETKIEKALTQIWCEIFNMQSIGVEEDFFEIGGDSLLMARAILKIRKAFNINVSIRQMLLNPSIRAFANFLEGNYEVSSTFIETPKDDIKLLKNYISLNKSVSTASSPPSSILITGASGFLGMHLLYDLYHNTQSKLYCLIRARDTQDAQRKLKNCFEKYHLTDLSRDNRIIPTLGDLSKPLLGFDKKSFETLSEKIDLIYHVGAFVHHIFDYEKLRSTNVLSTLELLRLATNKKIKPFHYVSSIVAALEKDQKGLIKEEFPTLGYCGDIDGYSQSKWVCEKLLLQAQEQGVPVNVYRPCTITGRSTDGVTSPFKDHLMNVIKGCIQMGLAPDWPLELDIIPVDLVSSLIIHASLKHSETGKIFNIINRNRLPWKHLITWLCNYGYDIRLVPESDWRSNLLNLKSDSALFPLVPLYLEDKGLYSELASEHSINDYQSNKAYQLFEAIDKVPPKIGNSLLSIYFSYLHECGFLELPPNDNKLVAGGQL